MLNLEATVKRHFASSVPPKGNGRQFFSVGQHDYHLLELVSPVSLLGKGRDHFPYSSMVAASGGGHSSMPGGRGRRKGGAVSSSYFSRLPPAVVKG